jgi:hypothetical protein
MSALGQKQTYAVQKGVSALPPIATLIAYFGMSARGQCGHWSVSPAWYPASWDRPAMAGIISSAVAQRAIVESEGGAWLI